MKNKQSALYLVPKATFYDKESVVVKQGELLHQQIMEEDRELYTYLLFFEDATYYSKALVIRNLLSQSLHHPQNKDITVQDPQRLFIEDGLILRSLYQENMTHALKMLVRLQGVNNARTSKLILRFLFRRQNADRIVIKYKKKFKTLLVQALGTRNMYHIVKQDQKGRKLFQKWIEPCRNPLALEIIQFVFGKREELTNTYLIKYQEGRLFFEEGSGILQGKDIPFEVLTGWNNFYKRGYSITDLLTKGNTSDKQRIQMQQAVRRDTDNQVVLQIDFSKYSAMELLKYIQTNGDTNITPAQGALESRLQSLSADVPSSLRGYAIVADFSASHAGSKESLYHSLYKNWILSRLLGTENSVFTVGGVSGDNSGSVYPSGDSNLTDGVIRAVKAGHRRILILSDGFENVGFVNEVVGRLKELGQLDSILHLNPVFSPKNFQFKSLGSHIPTLPVFDAEKIGYLDLYHLLNSDAEAFKKEIRPRIVNALQEILL